MSNGTPEPFEGGPEGPPRLIAILALVYAILWILVAPAGLLLGLPVLSESRVFWTSVALLALSLFLLGREIGLLPGARRR